MTLATPNLGVIPHPLCSTRRGWSNKENTQKCWSTPKLWPKIEIQDGGRPPSWIFKNLVSEHWDPLGCWFSTTVPNLAQKCWSTPNRVKWNLRPRISLWVQYLDHYATSTHTNLYCKKFWCQNFTSDSYVHPMYRKRHFWLVRESRNFECCLCPKSLC